MRVAVLSDSHGNTEFLTRALSIARGEGPLHTVIHLGDDHTDIDGLLKNDERAKTVPGIYHGDYTSGTAPASMILEAGALVVSMAHQSSDLPVLQGTPSPRLFLHGHTHSLSLSLAPWGLTFNPGHLAKPVDKGRVASFGLLSLAADELIIEGIALDGVRLLSGRWSMQNLRREGGL